MNEALSVETPDSNPVTAFIEATDGHQIPLLQWQPGSPAKAAVHICHGMSEHANRYQPLAETLTSLGYAVFAHNHRGHGSNTASEDLGHYADNDGWVKVTGDVITVQHFIRSQHPAIPQFLLGHSMGSFIAQGALANANGELGFAGLVLSGSGRDPVLKLTAFRAIVASQRWLKGERSKSSMIHTLTFGAFARTVKNRQTDFDWISHDNEAVARYVADPLCGFDCTTRLWQDLATGLAQLQHPETLSAIPLKLPILVMSGDEDPVGDFGKGVQRLVSAYRATGHQAVTLKLLPGLRHEPFNEVNRTDVYRILTQWLDDVLSPAL